MPILNLTYAILIFIASFSSCLISIFWLRCYNDVLSKDLKWLRFFKYKFNYNYDLIHEEDLYNESK